jgi:hypothetical protein
MNTTKTEIREAFILAIRLFLMIAALYLVYSLGLYNSGYRAGIEYMNNNYFIYDLNMRCINCVEMLNKTAYNYVMR